MSILNPKDFARAHLKNYSEEDLAQVGLDVRVARLYKIDNTSPAWVNDKKRTFSKRTVVAPIEGEYILFPGNVYEFESDVQVSMPINAAGLIIHRSSLLRNGVMVTSGWWDPCFVGNLNGFIIPQAGIVAIGEKERVGQFVVWEASACSEYKGIYQGTKGTLDAQPPTL